MALSACFFICLASLRTAVLPRVRKINRASIAGQTTVVNFSFFVKYLLLYCGYSGLHGKSMSALDADAKWAKHGACPESCIVPSLESG